MLREEWQNRFGWWERMALQARWSTVYHFIRVRLFASGTIDTKMVSSFKNIHLSCSTPASRQQWMLVKKLIPELSELWKVFTSKSRHNALVIPCHRKVSCSVRSIPTHTQATQTPTEIERLEELELQTQLNCADVEKPLSEKRKWKDLEPEWVPLVFSKCRRNYRGVRRRPCYLLLTWWLSRYLECIQ